MKQLAPNEFSKTAELFAPLDIHLAVTAGLRGVTPAQVFVDSSRSPRSAMMWIQHRFYLAGDPENASFNRSMRDFFMETLFPQRLRDAFVIYYDIPAWENALTHAILHDQPPIPIEREYYALDLTVPGALPLEPPPLPDGFSLAPVSRNLVEDTTLENLDVLVEEMHSERPSVDEFLKQSFGTVLLHGRKLAGWVLSEYNLDHRCEVGIATDAAYQRRGLATLAGRAFVEQARMTGITKIGWHCRKSNRPSGRSALKIGFKKIQDVYSCLIFADPVLNLAVHGDVLFHRQSFEAALEWFEQAFALGDPPGWAYLSAACAYSALGQQGRAFERLLQAVDRGFSDPAFLQGIECLKPLREMPEWSDLMKKLQE